MAFFTFDDDYVRRLRERDRETLEHFYAYFFALLYNMARRKTSEDEAPDVMQDIFLRVLQDLDKLREPSRLGAFVCGYARNILLEHGRLKRHESLSEVPDLPDPHDFLKELESEERKRQVLDALRRMDPKEAELLMDVFVEGSDRDEVCRKHGVTRDYLRVRLHRAIEHLRREVDPPDPPKKTPRSPETLGCLSSLCL